LSLNFNWNVSVLQVDRAILSFERNEEKLDVEIARFEFDLNLQTALFGLTTGTIATVCDNFLTSEWFTEPHKTKEFVSNLLLVVRTYRFMTETIVSLVATLKDEFFFGYLERRLLGEVSNPEYCRFLFSLHAPGLIQVGKRTEPIFSPGHKYRDWLQRKLHLNIGHSRSSSWWEPVYTGQNRSSPVNAGQHRSRHGRKMSDPC
jgi:hypothetical protein